MDPNGQRATTFKLITPNDSADLAFTAAVVRVGGAGDLKVTTVDNDTVVIPSCLAGELILCGVKRVWSTGTTATSLGAYC